MAHIKPNPVTDDEIETAFQGTNFGHTEYRELLAASVFKKMVGYHCGYTITCIMEKMKLIGKNGTATKRGKIFVREHFHNCFRKSG